MNVVRSTASALQRPFKSGLLPRSLTQEGMVTLTALVLFSVFSLLLDDFFTAGNLITLVRNVSVLGILSLGMAVVVIGRGIDLSLVAVMAISLTIPIVIASSGYSFAWGLVVGYAFALVVAIIQGWLIAYVEIPAIFTTIASISIIYGLGQIIAATGINAVPEGTDWFVYIGEEDLLGIPFSIWILAAATLLIHLFLRKTVLGRFIYAFGDNDLNARITGIPVRPLTVGNYVLSATMAFLAGIVSLASVTTMSTRIVNSTMIYDVLLIVVLGGIGLSGGRGGVRNVLVGTFLIAVLLNGMTIMDVPVTVQNLIKGLVLLGALGADALLNPRDEQTSQQGDI